MVGTKWHETRVFLGFLLCFRVILSSLKPAIRPQSRSVDLVGVAGSIPAAPTIFIGVFPFYEVCWAAGPERLPERAPPARAGPSPARHVDRGPATPYFPPPDRRPRAVQGRKSHHEGQELTEVGEAAPPGLPGGAPARPHLRDQQAQPAFQGAPGLNRPEFPSRPETHQDTALAEARFCFVRRPP